MKIEVLGGAREVGGSCVSVGTEFCKVALDYGTKLDEDPPVFPKDFDAVIVSHAHLDHSGNLLGLSKKTPVIVGSPMTRDVAVDLLYDMVKIQNHNGNKDFPYDERDAEKIRKAWWTRNSIGLPDMTLHLHHAGHVAGAKMTSVHAEDKKVLYTGDFCIHDTEILDGCNLKELPKRPDVLISESTYGGRVRAPRNELIEQLFTHVRNTIKRKGNILMPTFAFHRSQEMAKRIDHAMETGALPKYNVYTISNLANKINGYFNQNKQIFTQDIQNQNQPFKYRHVKHLYRTSQIKEPAIVICTSGFGHAGASLQLLADWAGNEANSVVLTSGYLPPDSPLTQAKEEGHFMHNNETITVNATVEQVELSGHADQLELIEMVRTLKPKQTLLVHGDLEQAQALSEEISHLTDVTIPQKGETLTI
ncbi:MAG: MBL fold metallo-hydrolase [Candidatus Bathyarchaeota archaeon]|nr:MBL fold metallo-hydrolase [Candidatus Bathyarchaeota archaeon]